MARNRAREFCKVCRHPERVQIERERAKGVSLRKIAVQFHLSTDSVERHHKRGHAPADTTADPQTRKRFDSVLQALRDEWELQMGLAADARAGKQFSAASSASDRARRAREKIDAMTAQPVNGKHGEAMAFYSSLQRTLIAALEPFPDARRAVSAALVEFERDQGLEAVEEEAA
jgi:hypothetical protein